MRNNTPLGEARCVLCITSTKIIAPRYKKNRIVQQRNSIYRVEEFIVESETGGEGIELEEKILSVFLFLLSDSRCFRA